MFYFGDDTMMIDFSFIMTQMTFIVKATNDVQVKIVTLS